MQFGVTPCGAWSNPSCDRPPIDRLTVSLNRGAFHQHSLAGCSPQLLEAFLFKSGQN